MTTPASGVISLTDVMTELRVANPSRAYPISLGDTDVRALAGVASGQISFNNLYGKSGFTVTGNSASATAVSTTAAGNVSCGPSVTVTGGASPFTYAWTFTSNPQSCTLANATTSQATVTHSYAKQASGSASATLQCVVTDSASNSRTVAANASLDWAGNL